MKSMNVVKKSAPVFIDDTHVQVTREFAKNARIFGTAEYKTWREIKKDVPDAKMVTKTIKRNPNKSVDTRNMTYEHMAMYISQQDGAEELMFVFRKTVMQSKVQNNPYRYVLAWFMKQFPKASEYKDFFEARAAEAKKEKSIFKIITNNTEIENDSDEADFDAAANY